MGFNPIEFAGFDQGRDDGPVLCPGIMASEERVFAVQGNWPDCALDGVGIQFDAAVVEEQDQPVPVGPIGRYVRRITLRGNFQRTRWLCRFP